VVTEFSRLVGGLYLAHDVESPPTPLEEGIFEIWQKLRLKLTMSTLSVLRESRGDEKRSYVVTWVHWAERRSGHIFGWESFETIFDKTENLVKAEEIGGSEVQLPLGHTLADGMRVACEGVMVVPFTTGFH
jgi:hypothetical protein